MRNFYILDAADVDMSLLTFVVPYVDLDRPMDWIAEQSQFWESLATAHWENGQLRTLGYPSLWDLGYPRVNPAEFFPLERSYVEDAFVNLVSSAWWFEIRYEPELSPLHAFSMDVCDLGIAIVVAGTTTLVSDLKHEARGLYRNYHLQEHLDETPMSVCSRLGIPAF